MRIEEKIDKILEELGEVKGDVKQLKGDVKGLKVDVLDLKNRMGSVEATVERIDTRVRKIEIYQETDLRKQYNALSETYSDLTNKLNEAIKVEDGNKMRDYKLIALGHRMDVMEDNWRQLKEA